MLKKYKKTGSFNSKKTSKKFHIELLNFFVNFMQFFKRDFYFIEFLSIGKFFFLNLQFYEFLKYRLLKIISTLEAINCKKQQQQILKNINNKMD